MKLQKRTKIGSTHRHKPLPPDIAKRYLEVLRERLKNNGATQPSRSSDARTP